MNESLPEQGSSIDFGDPTSNVYSNDKMNKQFFETAAQAFEELTTKYFNTDYYQYETFKNWAVIKTVHDAKRRATTIVYRCKPQPSDEPYTLFGLKTELDTCAELHFKDLLANVELETLENLEYESIKRIEWLGLQSDIIHVVLKDLNFLSPGREVVLARHWRKVNNAYLICNRSIETDKVPKSKKKIRYYTRFAAARYTPALDNENRCIYEGLVSGDPKEI
uniref:START domain-containing protein n=1 Tax=Plectus sambesii TaxID=2011161 RepID=A0A914VMU3_9BILA